MTTKLLGILTFAGLSSWVPLDLHAAPNGGNITGGAGTITTTNQTTTITQQTQSMAIDWHSYDLNANEIVNYLQPDASSLSLNRILSNSASQILGQINANGQVILVNPNGLFFGESAAVNVGGLIASGLDIDPVDFMNGDFIFSEVVGTDGQVINSGLINASLGGNVALLGKQVNNEGVINARLGSVSLATGKEAILTFDQQGLLGVRVSREILQDELGVDPALINNGVINASGGRVLLTASVSRDVFSQAVNHDGIEQATSVVVHEDGSFTLGGGADVVNSGAINVSAVENAGQVVMLGENIRHGGSIHADTNDALAGMVELHAMDKIEIHDNAVISAQAVNSGQGGDIKLLGDKIGLFGMSEINASGVEGGGEILIGGDRQGLNPNIRNAEFLYIDQNSNVFADALGYGDGGRIIAYANDTGRFYGGLYARGGLAGGNGGFIETSGKKGFEIPVAPDVSASAGDGGLWLIDPFDITIVNGDGTGTNNIDTTGTPYFSDGTPAVLEIDTILAGLAGGDVEIQTVAGDGGGENGDIIFDANLDYDGTGNNSLTFNSDGGIAFTSTSTIGDSNVNGDTLHISLFANDVISLNGSITTQGGTFTVGGAGGNTPSSFTNNGTIDTTGLDGPNNTTSATAGGDINITVNGSFNSTGLNSSAGNQANSSNSGSDFDGMNAGSITVVADSISFSGDLDANGGAARYDENGTGDNGRSGGNGGTISLTTNAGVINVINLTSDGGAAAGDSTGGSPDSGDGGSGGNILLTSQLGVGDINLGGDMSVAAQAGEGNGSDGTQGNITIDGTLIVTNAFTVNANSFTSDDIQAGSVSAAGNSVTINADTFITTGNITTDGGVAAAGQNAGDVELNAADITIGAISAVGGDATGPADANGGNGGAVTIVATDNGGTPSITLNGNINTSGGVPFNDLTLPDGGVAGNPGTKDIRLEGGGGADGSLSIGHTGAFADVTITSNTDGADTLNAADIDNNFIMTGVNSGTLNTNITFNNFEQLNGGATGTNTLVGQNLTNNWALASANAGNLNGAIGFTNMQVLTGGTGADTLVASTKANTWIMTNPTDGAIGPTDLLTFTGMEILQGGGDEDTFDLTALGDVSVSLQSGLVADMIILEAEIVNASSANNNTLIGANGGDNSWAIDGINSGSYNATVSFDGFRNFRGGDQADDFVFSGAGQLLLGAIDGAGGANSVTGLDSANDWTLTSTSSGSLVNGGNSTTLQNIQSFIGGSGDDTLTNTIALEHSWNISGNGAGTVTGLTAFSGMENLVGGALNDDDFVFSGSGQLNGVIDGNGGNNSVTGLNSANIWTLTSTDNGSLANGGITTALQNIQTFTGGSGDDTLINTIATAHVWNIDSVNGGTVDSLSGRFDGIENLTGGTQADSFAFTATGGITGLIDGNSGTDSLNIATLINDTIVEVGNAVTANLNIVNLESLTAGNALDNTLIADNQANDWLVDGINSGSLNGMTFVGFNRLLGNAQADTFLLQNGWSIANGIDAGNGNDIADGSAVTSLVFQIGPGGLDNFEQFIGNNTDSTLIGDNQINDWQITGNNSGTVGTQNFQGFSHLVGNDQVDTFNVSSNGALSGEASGGAGDDVVNVALSGSENGGFTFDGGADNDSVNLTGGNADYQGQYQSDAGGLEQFVYSLGGNSFTMAYSDVEGVNDSVSSASLSILGTASDDSIQLGDNRFIVNSATAINHSGNSNLIIDGLGGSDNVSRIVASTVNTGTLTFNNVDNIGSAANQLVTDISQIELNNVSGDVFIDEINQINIGRIDNLGGSLQLSNQTGDILDSTALISNANLRLTAQNGDIRLDNSNQLGGELSLSAVNGDITFNNSIDTQLAGIRAQNLGISTTADITDSANAQIRISGASTLSATGADIILDADNQFGNITVSAANNLTLNDTNSSGLGIERLTVNNAVRLTSAGAIFDRNGNSDNIITGTLTINAVAGIGSNDAIETRITTLDASNSGSGEINISQTGVINLTALQNTGSNGDINFRSDDDINFNPGSTVAALGTGDLIMTTDTGSFLGLGAADNNNPDIIAQNATFIGRAGTFGSFDRSLVLYVPGSVLINTRGSFEPQFVIDPPNSVTSTGIDFTVIGAISAVAGEQLVEIESLSEVDPAIFTALRNYSLEDISIRMPRDQLYDDELEQNAFTQ